MIVKIYPNDYLVFIGGHEVAFARRCLSSLVHRMMPGKLHGATRSSSNSAGSLSRFAENKRAIFFSAQQVNDHLALEQFSAKVLDFFEEKMIRRFDDWVMAFDFIGQKAANDRFILIIDEFPYLANANPAAGFQLPRRCAVLPRFNQTGSDACVCHLGWCPQLHPSD